VVRSCMVYLRMVWKDSNDIISVGEVKWSNVGNRVVVL
jgi:hypothetical protein